jgi:hypothetical protein
MDGIYAAPNTQARPTGKWTTYKVNKNSENKNVEDVEDREKWKSNRCRAEYKEEGKKEGKKRRNETSIGASRS